MNVTQYYLKYQYKNEQRQILIIILIQESNNHHMNEIRMYQIGLQIFYIVGV